MEQSKIFQLNWNDALKGFVTAVAGAVVATIANSINQGNFQIGWTPIWHGALVAGVAYITKNFFTPAPQLK